MQLPRSPDFFLIPFLCVIQEPENLICDIDSRMRSTFYSVEYPSILQLSDIVCGSSIGKASGVCRLTDCDGRLHKQSIYELL